MKVKSNLFAAIGLVVSEMAAIYIFSSLLAKYIEQPNLLQAIAAIIVLIAAGAISSLYEMKFRSLAVKALQRGIKKLSRVEFNKINNVYLNSIFEKYIWSFVDTLKAISALNIAVLPHYEQFLVHPVTAMSCLAGFSIALYVIRGVLRDLRNDYVNLQGQIYGDLDNHRDVIHSANKFSRNRLYLSTSRLVLEVISASLFLVLLFLGSRLFYQDDNLSGVIIVLAVLARDELKNLIDHFVVFDGERTFWKLFTRELER